MSGRASKWLSANSHQAMICTSLDNPEQWGLVRYSLRQQAQPILPGKKPQLLNESSTARPTAPTHYISAKQVEAAWEVRYTLPLPAHSRQSHPSHSCTPAPVGAALTQDGAWYGSHALNFSSTSIQSSGNLKCLSGIRLGSQITGGRFRPGPADRAASPTVTTSPARLYP